MMRFFLALVVSAQLLSCKAIGLPPPSSPHQALDCDDPESEAAALAAVASINGNHQHGYKFTLNQIEKVKVKTRRPDGMLYDLELDLLETKCHVLSPTPLQECSVRPVTEHAVEGDCDVKVLKRNDSFTVLSQRCKSQPDSAEDIAKICPTCPVLAPLNDTQVAQAIESLLLQYNSQDDQPYFQLHEIGRARIRTLPDKAVEVEFVILATNCSVQDAKNAVDSCERQTGDDRQFGFCVGTVEKYLDPEENVLNCTIFPPQIGPTDPLAPQQPAQGHLPVPGHAHHHLHHLRLSSTSSESSSSEDIVPTTVSVAAPTAANPIVKRSLTGEPVPEANVVLRPVCPGKIRFF